MHTYCFDSIVDLPLLKDDSLLKINFPTYHNKLNPSLFIHSDLIDFLNSKDLHVLHFELFYAKPYLKSGIHTDVIAGNIAKLNYVFGGEGSTMNWFKQKIPGPKPMSISDIGTPYQYYAPDEVDLVYSKHLGRKPALVQVGLPHNIENFAEPRHCFSCVIGYRSGQTFERLTMQQAIDIFGC